MILDFLISCFLKFIIINISLYQSNVEHRPLSQNVIEDDLATLDHLAMIVASPRFFNLLYHTFMFLQMHLLGVLCVVAIATALPASPPDSGLSESQMPEESAQPALPDQPEESAQLEQPGQPEQSEETEQSEKPEEPALPEQPAQPGESDEDSNKPVIVMLEEPNAPIIDSWFPWHPSLPSFQWPSFPSLSDFNWPRFASLPKIPIISSIYQRPLNNPQVVLEEVY